MDPKLIQIWCYQQRHGQKIDGKMYERMAKFTRELEFVKIPNENYNKYKLTEIMNSISEFNSRHKRIDHLGSIII